MSASTSASTAVRVWMERWTPRGVFVVSLCALLVLRGSVLRDPPYWDALLGAFPQAIWSVDHGLSLTRLLREGGAYADGGTCVYPFSIYPWTLALLYAFQVPIGVIFVAFHVLGFASAAGLLACVHALARRQLGAHVAAWCVVALGCWPLFQSLACQMNMDMPLAACGAAAVLALLEGRLFAAWSWTLLALLVKPTGVILVGAQASVSALAWIAPRAFGFEAETRRAHAAAVAGYLLLAALFLAELKLLEHSGTTPRGIEWLSGFGPLFTRRLWYVPEFGIALVLALVALAVALVRSRRGGLTALETATASFLVLFLAFYGQFTNVLPRYFLQAAPFLIVFLAVAATWSRVLGRWIPLSLATFALVCLANSRGVLYPAQMADQLDPRDGRPPVASNGHMLERSLEYEDDLALARELVRRLERYDRSRTVIVANWPFEQLLSEPRLGYVDRAFRTASAEIAFLGAGRPVAYEALYRGNGERTRKNVPEDIRWVVSPNVFAGGSSRVLGSDDEVECLEVGRLRAFVIHRRGWE